MCYFSIAYLGLPVKASFQRLIFPLSVEQLHWSIFLHSLKAGTRLIKQIQKTKHRRMATIILSVISCGQNIYWFEGSDEGIEGQLTGSPSRAKQKGNHANCESDSSSIAPACDCYVVVTRSIKLNVNRKEFCTRTMHVLRALGRSSG